MRLGSIVLACIVGIICATPSLAAVPAPIQYTRVTSDSIAMPSGALSSTWVSQTIQPQSAFTRLVASWNADTPAAARITVQAQVTTTTGETSDWYTLGVWAADDSVVQRTSVNGQADSIGRVATDTLSAKSSPFATYSLRVRLERASADDPSPTVRSLGAAVSDSRYAAGSGVSSPL